MSLARSLLRQSISLAHKIHKGLWLILFKLTHPKSPILIATAFEHRHFLSLGYIPDLVIDVGFNKGQFSSLALEAWRHVPVLAFDPHPSCFKSSADQLTAAYGSRFKFSNIALGDANKSVILNLSHSSDNSSLCTPTNLNNKIFPRSQTFSTCQVQQITLSSFVYPFSTFSSILLKIDVQGSELSVLQGIDKTTISRIKYIYIEVTEVDLYESQPTLSVLTNYLNIRGYDRVSTYNQNNLDGNLLYADCLFVRRC
ncbi:FkbM family methyltransferase [Synechococcus sp. W4D4]|uniref:FkbM family methyltransferase n=1 Tax=Synechococcus sp. W4D4 TaxID=3392294 RepID=UPI0039E8920A